jgi:hypothetical protein
MFGSGGTSVIDSAITQQTIIGGDKLVTVQGFLNIDEDVSIDRDLTVTRNSILNGNVQLGNGSADLITQYGTLYLNGPVKDTTDTLGDADQILVSDASGELTFTDLSTITVESAEVVQVPVKNLQGSPLTKGDPVYISGSVGASGRLEVQLADASNPAKMPAVGLLKQDLGINEEGFAVVTGKLRNLPTDPIDGGSPLPNAVIYVKAGGTTGAALTLIKPTGSNLIQNMGKVGRVSTVSDGTLVVSSILRTNDIPNLTPGKIWVGSTGNTIESNSITFTEATGAVQLNQYGSNTITGTEAYTLSVDASGNIIETVPPVPPNDATITLSAGTNLTGGGSFTTDQSTNDTITFNMATGGIGAGTYGSTLDSTKIDTITVDAYGRVTAVATGATGSMSSFTISDGTNTDTISDGNTMQFGGQNGLTATVSPTPLVDYVRFSLDNTGPGAGTYGSTSDDVKIDTITLDAQGRVTAIATGTTGDITGVTAGTGLSGGGTSGSVTLDLDLGELTTGGTLIGTDYLIAENGGVDNRQLISSIPLSIFNNDAGWTSNTGTVTEVTVGAGLDVTNGTTTPEITVDFAELTDMTEGMLTADELVVIDASDLGTKRKQVSEIGLSLFDNNAGFVTTSGFTMNNAATITMPKSTSGSAAGSEVLFMNHTATFGGSLNLRSEIQNGSFGVYRHMLFTHAGAIAGSIARSGNTTVSYNTSSDYRLKENVTEITDGIDRVKQLKPSKFNFIGEERIVDGFLAHEVQSVVPESIMGEKDEIDDEGNPLYQAIDQSKMVPLLAAALKEAIIKIENLETRIQVLEGI